MKSDSIVVLGHPQHADEQDALLQEAGLDYCRQVFSRDQLNGSKYVLVMGKENWGKQAEIGKFTTLDGYEVFATFSPGYLHYKPGARSQIIGHIHQFLGTIHGENYEISPVVVNDRKSFSLMMDDLEQEAVVSFDHETTSLYPWKGRVVTLGWGTAKHQYIMPRHFISQSRLKAIAEVMQECTRVGHSAKFDLLWTKVKYGIDWGVDFDTMLADYLLDENKHHGLKELASTIFGVPNWEVKTETKQGRGDWQTLLNYQANDLLYTRRLYFKLKPRIQADAQIFNVFRYILMPLVQVFVKIEYQGLTVDHKQFRATEAWLIEQRDQALAELSKFADINWGSPQQVGKLLFEELKIEPVLYTKKGSPSTNESVMNQLAIKYPIARKLVEYRGHKQQLSFFIDGWKPYLVPHGEEHRIHPSFKLHGTVTGRLSCEHPNLQQTPRDSRIRSLIIAPRGFELVEFDLSQIELRIAAELSGDVGLTTVFQTGQDAHWKTAMREIFRGGGLKELVERTASALEGRPIKYAEAHDILMRHGPDAAADVAPEWKEYRKKAKAVNFGYLFGMWWRKFIQYAFDNYGVIVSEKEAQQSRKSFFELYPGLEDWHNRQRSFVRRNGYVRSLSGRKRRLPDAMSGVDSPAKREAERQAINSPVQSFANELNLMALIEIDTNYPDVVPVGTVHDSILALIPTPKIRQYVPEILEMMKHPPLLDKLGIRLSVPIEAEAKIGPWGKGVSLEKYK